MFQHFTSFALQFPALREFVAAGKPVWGTCAGLIFLANKAVGTWLTSQ
jgi:glutamine amidotransferase PdxT